MKDPKEIFDWIASGLFCLVVVYMVVWLLLTAFPWRALIP